MRRVSCVPLGYTRKLNQPFRENKTTVTSPPIWTIQSLEKSVAQLHTFFFKRRVGGRYRSEFAFRMVFSRRLATKGFTWVDSQTFTQTWQTDIVGLFLPPMVSADQETSQSFEFHKLRQLNVELVPSKKVQNVGWQLYVAAVSSVKQFAKFG